MVKVERVDQEKSFQTLLKFIDGYHTQEIYVNVWEADGIELALKDMSLDTVNSFYNKSGIVTIKEW